MMFVAYCANQAGISTSIIPKTASVSEILSFAKTKKRFKARDSGYKPQPGDIMIQKENGASHVGIVSITTGDTVSVIEGNSSNAVKLRSYALSNSNITGWFVPDYTSSGKTLNSGAKAEDLCSTTVKSVVTVGGEINQRGLYNLLNDENNDYELHIVNYGVNYMPIVLSGVKWTTKWQDAAGELEFEILKDSNLDIQEGNAVSFSKGGTGIFYGYIFTKSRTKNGVIKIKAYDQLRYLKNKDTYCYSNKTYAELVKMIAADYMLTTGTLENTKTALTRVCDNETLFDIFKEAREDTKENTGIDYVLYDDYGKLSLKSTDSLQTNYLLCGDVAEDFSYKTSIDKDVYNCIQLYKDDDESGDRAKYYYKDAANINKWGVLQYTKKLDDEDVPNTIGENLLNEYNQKKRELTVKKCLGDLSLRAGAKVYVSLDLGDVIYKNVNCVITKAVHNFGQQYSCELTISKN